MESIQLAQMLADLSDLNASHDSQAAVRLVSANKTLNANNGNQPTPTTPATPSEAAAAAGGQHSSDGNLHLRPPIRPGQRHHNRTGSAGSIGSAGSSFISRTASPAKFDKYGRRILTPPNTRANSTYGSVPGTPRMTGEIGDDDVDRAGSLMALYEIRAKLKDQDNRSLSKLREKISALQIQRQLQEAGGKGGEDGVGAGPAAGGGGGGGSGGGKSGGRARFTFPKDS